MFANHGRPDQTVNVLDRLDLRLGNAHLLHDTPALISILNRLNIFNTVVLVRKCPQAPAKMGSICQNSIKALMPPVLSHEVRPEARIE
jgi:hypothetical protein